MRVTFLLPMRPVVPIGGFRVVYQYANGLAARGHDVQILHPARLRQHPRRLPTHPVALARHAVGTVRSRRDRGVSWHQVDPRVGIRFVPTLDARHVPTGDAVVATAWETAEYAVDLPADRGSGFYLIQHHETWSGPEERVNATWRLPLHKVVIARWLLDQAHDMGLDDVVHIPNAIDLEQFQVRRAIGDRPPRVAMLYSTWHSWKGTDVGLRALRLAKAAVPDLQAVVFGVDEPPQDVPDWVEVRRLPSPAELVDDIYNGSAVYLCPSAAEGWHLPPAEAMACGCALVSTDIGGVKDYAQGGHNSLLAAVGDAEALADGVVRLVSDDALRTGLARAAVETMSGFSWARSTDALERYLLEKTGLRV